MASGYLGAGPSVSHALRTLFLLSAHPTVPSRSEVALLVRQPSTVDSAEPALDKQNPLHAWGKLRVGGKSRKRVGDAGVALLEASASTPSHLPFRARRPGASSGMVELRLTDWVWPFLPFDFSASLRLSARLPKGCKILSDHTCWAADG